LWHSKEFRFHLSGLPGSFEDQIKAVKEYLSAVFSAFQLYLQTHCLIQRQFLKNQTVNQQKKLRFATVQYILRQPNIELI